MWNNARQAAEEVIGDVIWPVQVSLHSCQVTSGSNQIANAAAHSFRSIACRKASEKRPTASWLKRFAHIAH
jgi:hypothetical protein